jgi:hypothetical protein
MYQVRCIFRLWRDKMAVAEKKDPAMKIIGLAGEDTDSPVATCLSATVTISSNGRPKTIVVKKLFVDTQHFRDSSYVDAVSFSLMQEMEITEAFAFDQHFGTVGFICVP